MPPSLPLFDDPASPGQTAGEMLRRARPVEPGHHDELRQADGLLRPAWQAFADHLDAPLDDLARRQALLARQIREDGITYNVYSAREGLSRPWPLDVLPYLIDTSTWRALEEGVVQRARLLERVLDDVYGEQRILREALLPSALVHGHPGYLRGLQGCRPAGGVYLHVVAFDLVRGPDGRWWVVSQRTQAPSGLGYVMQNRLIVSRLFPQAYRAMKVQHLASAYRRLLDTLGGLAAACAPGGTPRLALLTPGPYNETYFEHAYLARYLGLPLVEGGDLVVRDEGVFLKTVQGLEPVHGLLRRLDDDFCDPLELRADSTLGIPGLMQAVRAGRIVLANALGTGFLESPAVHGFLPALSERLLGEPLALSSLPTWWCGEPAAWADVQADLRERVIRPSYPVADLPGGGVGGARHGFNAVIGRGLSEAALADWRQRIEQEPAAYTVQRFVPYAQAPVWSAGAIELREASLRVYALSDGRGGWQVLPGGMTRIATREAGPVSMQLGGSSLDTWVPASGPVDTFSMLTGTVRPDEHLQRERPVASRTGENLFWMGRYAERIEQQLRLLRVLVSLQAADEGVQAPVSRALSALAQGQGLVSPNTPGLGPSPRVFERAALDALADVQGARGACSLGFNLAALGRAAQSLRDRLSPEHARWLRAMQADFEQRLSEARGDASVGAPSTLAQMQDAFDHLGMQLAAVTGAQTDRMTRDAGWRLLTVGRLIERLCGYVAILQAFAEHGALRHPQGFDLAVELFDSTITFRARFQRQLERPALLALLVMDATNPRALACVLHRLRTELAKLPARGGARDDLPALLPHQGVGADLEALCDPDQGDKALSHLLQRLLDAGWRLSDEVGRRYFAHAEPTDSMVSA